MEDGRIVYTSELSDKGYADGAKRIQQHTRELTSVVEKSGSRMEQTFDDLSKKIGAVFAVGSLVEFGKKIVEVRSEMESLQKSFESLAGERIGKQLYEDIKQFATSTPMMMNDLAKGAQTLLGFNIAAEKVMPILRQIGDISMGDAQKFNSLTLAFAQMSSTGKLMGQDLLQMINAGFNPLVVIAEKTGKSVAQLKDEMSKGAISVEMVEEAFRAATAEGGKFHNMLETQSKTLKGAISNMQGAYQDMLNAIGDSNQGILMEGVNLATLLAKNYETIGKVIIDLIATYGAYKAACMTLAAVQALQATGVGALTAAETIHYGWLVLVEKAQALLNKTMLANPYILAATAITALVGALVMFKKGADEATESQRKLDSAFADTQAQIASEQKNIDELFDKLRKAEKGTNEYKETKDKILNQYGTYLRGLSNEIATLKNVEGAYKAVTKAAREASLARGKEAALKDVQDTYGSSYANNIGKLQSALKSVADDKTVTEIMGRVNAELNDFGNITTQLEGRIKNLFRGTQNYGNAGAWITGLRNNEKYLKDYSDLIEQRFHIDEEEAKHEEEKQVRNKQAIEEEKKNLQAELDNLSKEEAIGQKGAKLKEKIRNLDKELKAYNASDKESFKATLDALKRTKEGREYLELLEQQTRERIRAAKDLELSTAQAQIDAMDDGSQKTIAQIRIDLEKQKEEIERGYQDIKQKKIDAARAAFAKDPANNNRVFDASTVDTSYSEAEQNNRLERLRAAQAEFDRRMKEEYQKQIQYLHDYMKEYGSLQDQRAAITAEYDQKIADTTDTVQKAALQKQKENALKELDFKELQQSINWEAVFNDLDKLSKTALEDLKKKLKDALDMKDITPENAKVLSEKLLEIDNRLSDNMWTSMIPALKERLRLVNEVKNAEEDIARAQQKAMSASLEQQKSLSGLQSVAKVLIGRNLTKDELAAESGAELAKNLKLTGESAKQLAESFDKNKMTTIDLTSAQQQLTEAQRQAKYVNNMLKSFTGKGANGQNFGSALTSIFKNAAEANGGSFMGYATLVQNNINSMAEFTDKIGLAGTDFGEAVHGFSDGVNGFMSAIQSLASGDVFGAVNGVIDGLAGFGKSLTAVFGINWSGGNEEEHAKREAELIKANENLQKSIDNLKESFDKANGMKAIEISRKIIDSQQKYNDNLMERWENDMYYHSAHHTNNYYWGGFSQNQIAAINSLMSREGYSDRVRGTDWTELTKMTPEALAAIRRELPEIWDFITSQGKYSWVYDSLNEYADMAGKIAEQEAALKENLTQLTDTSLHDSFLSDLMDMEKKAEDFGDDFSEILMKAVLNAKIGDLLDEDLTKWRDELSRRMESSGGTLNNNDVEVLRKMWDDITEKGLEMRNQIADITGYGTKAVQGYFSNLRDLFKSFFSDTAADTEEWSKNIAQSIANELIEKLVLTDEFDKWLEEWKSRYAEVLDLDAPSERKERMQALIEELNAMRDKTGEKAKEIRESLGLIAEGEAGEESVFSNLRDTFLDTLTDMEQDVEAFRKKLEETMIRDVLDKQVFDVPITVNGMSFDDFDAYVTNWNSRYAEAVKSGNQEAIDALLDELVQVREMTIEQAEELRNRLKEVTADTTFKDMADSWGSTLMDMSKTAEDWAQDVGKTIAEKIVNEFVVTSAVQPLLNNLQEAFNAAMNAEGATAGSIISAVLPQLEQLKAAFPEIHEIVKGIMEALGLDTSSGRQVEGFGDLRSTFVSTLTDMESDAESFGKDIGRTLMEQMVDQLIKSKYQEQIDALNEEWREALGSGDTEAIERIRKAILDLYAAMGNDAEVKSLADDIKNLSRELDEAATPFDNLRSSYLSTLMDMSKQTKDWTKEISQMIAESFVDSFVLGSAFDEKLEEWKKRYKDITEDSSLSEEQRMKQLKTLAELIAADTEDSKKQVSEILKWLGIREGQDQSVTMNMAEAATYDQFELYLGMATSHLMVAEQTKSITQQILSTLQSMSGITSPSENYGQQIFMRLGTTNEYLLAVKKATEAIRSEFATKLDIMNSHLSKL